MPCINLSIMLPGLLQSQVRYKIIFKKKRNHKNIILSIFNDIILLAKILRKMILVYIKIDPADPFLTRKASAKVVKVCRISIYERVAVRETLKLKSSSPSLSDISGRFRYFRESLTPDFNFVFSSITCAF